MGLRNRLKEVRPPHDPTLEALAEMAGVSRQMAIPSDKLGYSSSDDDQE